MWIKTANSVAWFVIYRLNVVYCGVPFING